MKRAGFFFRAGVVLTVAHSLAGNPLHAQAALIVNQVGFRPDDKKIAFLKEGRASQCIVVDVRSNKQVFKQAISPLGRRDPQTGDTIFPIDFSGLRTPGTYQLWIPEGQLSSDEFRIAEDVYRPVVKATVESFYFQRCGTKVGDNSIWKHPPCHLEDAYHYDAPALWRDVRGGWHDAGDYGKFVVTGALSAAFLLYSYERSPGSFADGELSIPESGNGVPDILDEVRWELDWLLRMQTTDGGVFHKTSTKGWTGEHLPHKDPDKRYLFSVSSTATGAFAAVTALGARLFDEWDKQFARKLLKASLGAWGFLKAHANIVPAGGFRNPPGVDGGEYEDDSDLDERLWAAVEVYRLAKTADVHSFILQNYSSLGGFTYSVSWKQVQNLAYASYLRLPLAGRNPEVAEYFSSTLISHCDQLLQRIDASGYCGVLADGEYYWGSNSVATGYAFNLIQAFDVTGRKKYLEGALDQLHIMLGRNTFSRCFVTGLGTHRVEHPYHQFSIVLDAGAPVPGLAVGGANRYSRLNGKVISEFPGKCYEDNEKNYFVNEVAINYTAPLTYLAACLLRPLNQTARVSSQVTRQ